ncbi:uncharacterized protein [Ptychodera flava]|uniref:uncharacterized protein n=1 Tax=Ptychodera flava TaxID=63121 RepID=UPI00396A8CD5
MSLYIQKYISDIKTCVKSFDGDYVNLAWDVLRESIVEVRNHIRWLRNIQINSRDVNAEVDNAIRQVKRVYRILLEECVNIKHYSKQFEYMLQCLKEEVQSRHEGVDTFLWRHRLQRYKALFDNEDIEYFSEIAEMDLGKFIFFREYMERQDFKVLMKEIEKAELNTYYIQHCMEGDVTRLGSQCDLSLEKVTSSLNGSLTETQKVTLSVIRHLESRKSRNETAGFGFKVLGTIGLMAVVGGLLSASIVGAVVAGVGAAATGVGVAGTAQTQNEVARIRQQTKEIKSMMSHWEGVIKHGIISWKELIIRFKELRTLLKEGVVKLRREELYDITSHFQAAEKSLGNFNKETSDFAEEVRRVVNT